MIFTANHHDPDQLEQAVIDASRRAGCTCVPTVDLTELHPGEYRATVAHDHGCRLLARKVASWN